MNSMVLGRDDVVVKSERSVGTCFKLLGLGLLRRKAIEKRAVFESKCPTAVESHSFGLYQGNGDVILYN